MTGDIKKSKKSSVIKFIIGGLLAGFSVYRVLNIANSSPLWASYPGLVVLVIGIVDILKGILSKGDSKTTRTIETGIGIIAIVVGLLVEAYVSGTTSKMTWFISIFLMVQSGGFIATGITQSAKSKATRVSKIIVGAGIIVVLTGWFFEYHDLPVKLITILLSINLFIIGMEIITSAIKHKIAKSS